MKKFKPTEFYKETKQELEKVNWPSREATMTTSVVVLVVVGIITAYLGVVDVVVSRLMRAIIG